MRFQKVKWDPLLSLLNLDFDRSAVSQSLKLSVPDKINDRRALQEDSNINQLIFRLNALNFYLRKVLESQHRRILKRQIKTMFC